MRPAADSPAESAAPVAEPPAEPQRVYATDLEGSTVEQKKVLVDDDNAPEPAHMCEQLPPKDEHKVDWARRKLEESGCSLALWFDGVLGDEYNYESARRVRGRLEVSQAYSEFYGSRLNTRFNMNVESPNAKHRLSAFLGRDNFDDFVSDRQETSNIRSSFPQMQDEDQWLAGLGYALPGTERFQSNLRLGVSGGITPPNLFVQNRNYFRLFADDRQIAYLRGTPFWEVEDGYGFTAGFNYSRILTRRLLARWNNVATASQRGADGVDWRSSTTLYQGLHGELGLAWEAFIRGETDDDVRIHEYGVESRFRHPLVRHRLYAEWELGYSFPREDLDDERKGSYAVGFGVELPFGQRRKE
jgi:hypothetical protein